MQTLTFAVVAKSVVTHELIAGFCLRLEQLTGLAIRPHVLASNAEMQPLLAAREVDLAWASPLVAMELEDQRVANLLTVVQRPFSAGYHSALFVRADSPIQTLHDLVGAVVAWVSPRSASGYLVPRWHLRSQGVELGSAFSKELFLPSHEAVAHAVWSSEAEVGATYVLLDPISGHLASAPWQPLASPDSGVRVLLLVGPIPSDVIAARRDVALDSQRRLIAALLAMRSDDAGVGALFDATSFEPVPDGHLALLRRLSRYASEQRAG